MSTKSRRASAKSASAESYQRAPGRCVASTVRCAGRASVPATISTSRRRRQAGTCPWRAMLPTPTIAPRSMLLEPVLADDGAERLVQDREPGQCLLFTDHERRVDADRRRVGHRDQAAMTYAPSIRINPPLVIREEQALAGLAILDEALGAVVREHGLQ